ncbi:brachyurin-like [Neocloeon triangulifer]|uniref:brachyurin-like n=1 Tax=Neocloeon triangulifer TaxID=2078957 RepID=UPI00286F0167|nr:brachyurin-like [Neocloeon triangulifer]
MRTVIALALLVVAAQAVEWQNIKPRHAYRNTIRPVARHSRIVGGVIASPGQFPFQAGLYLDGSGFCGGSLISDTVVMTAAHCCDGTRTYDAHLGAQVIGDQTEPNHQVVRSTDGQLHENYNSFTLDNDICVIRLPAPVSGNGIASVRLPSRSQVGETFQGVVATSSGWGRPSDADPSISQDLRFVDDVTIMSNAECASYFGSIITPRHLCIDTTNGGVCNGDSGGPLTIFETDGVKTQVGVTSFVSSAGCESGSPHGYCRVSEYLDWLATNAGVTIRP